MMKNLLFTLLVFTFLSNYAQSTYIPDTNFEIALANLGYDDGALNNAVPTANISSITNLFIPSKGISDLTGIEDFVSLTFLNCASNNLSTVNISNNTSLTIFSCSGNSLTSLDVSNHTALRSLSIVNNQITSIDLSTNLLLESLYASNNLLTSLDLSVQPNLIFLDCDNNLLTSLSVKNGHNNAIPNADFTAINNPNLLCIEVDNATYSTANWTNIDVQTAFRTTCALTYVPDNNFEQELINLGYDTVLDDYVYTEDIKLINSLNLSSKGIADLTGIEDFEDLSYLDVKSNLITNLDVSQNSFLISLNCSNNQITSLNLGAAPGLSLVNCNTNLLNSLDVSNLVYLLNLDCSNNNLTNININNNTPLKYLYCGDNQLTNININNNSQLIYLSCVNNQISNLDISNNLLLTNLSCRNNQLTALDTSANVVLNELICGYNLITSLNLSTNIALTSLFCPNNQLTDLNLKNGNNTLITSLNYNTINNSNLYCIQVDNYTYSNSNWYQVDSQSIYRNSCAKTYVPDDNFEQALIDDGFDINPTLDDYIYTEVANITTGLYFSSRNISDLTGLEDFTSLTNLDLNDNNLTSIDLSVLLNLQYLFLNNNLFADLDLSVNTSLVQFTCTGNQLSELDLNNNNLLYLLHCNQNQLTRLNFKNGNNSVIPNSYFKANANPNLLCIEVDSESYSNTTWTNIDAHTSFSDNCHYDETYVPDNNFEQELINLGYDTVLDDYVITANINTLTTINLSAKGISDLTGLEDFIALETLLCVGNSLTSIDISNNTNLLSLNCQSNSITSIDTSNNLVLDTLNCESNAITNLDFTQNTFLTTLNCSDNILTSLNVFYNTNLATLNCSNNQIGALNLITNTNLSSLDCSHNILTGLILTNGNNTAITNTNFDATFNVSLTCIEVDDEIYSTTNWTNIDFHTSFSNNCHYGETYVPDNNFEQELINLGYDSILDDYVITSNVNTVGILDVSFKSINDLTGIGDFMALTQLICNNNNMTNLDLDNNFNLTSINCSFNLLSDLYISSLNLNFLSASNNQLLDLDLSGKLFLTHVELQNNLLNSLNIKNGNNTIITNFNITTNPNLFCTQVDDSAYSTTNWTNKDAHTFYNTNCNYPSIWRTAHWINGVPSLTKDAIIDDAYNTGAFGSFNAYSLNINIGHQVTISPNSYIRVNTNVINNGDFTIEHEGSFLQLQDFASVGGTGNFTVKSKTTSLIDADRFTYFSSPTANENLNVFASWANTGNMWSFDTSIQDWSLESSSNNMLLAKGYAIKGQPDVGQYPFKGTTNLQGYFNNGIISVPMHFTAGDPLLDDDSTLIGNPYPSAVSATLLLNNNLNANAFYFWTHTSILGTSGYIADDYAIWNRSGGVASSSGSPAPTGYIASCQGFFVTSLATDNFIFDNSVRVTGNNNDFRTLTIQENEDKIWLNLTDDNGLFNQILLNFSEDGSYNYDPTFDAKRFNSDYPIQFYSKSVDNERFAIQALPILLENEIIPLGCNVIDESVTNLKISIDHLENFDNVTIYLKDNLLNNIHDLKTSDYHFEVITPTNSNRFELILNRDALNLNENEFINEQLIISNLSENKISIKSKKETIITSLKAYDVLGKLVLDVKPNQANFIIPVNLNQGTILFFNAILKNGSSLKTKFIKL